MKEKFGKNEASHIGKRNTAIMIVSILSVALFIGTALQPAIASPMTYLVVEVEDNEDECPLCRSRESPAETKPKCKTCLSAAGFAVKHGINYTRGKIIEKMNNNDVWEGVLADISLWLIEGVGQGIKLSGFKIELDKEELNETIKYYVNKYVGPQGHNVTKIFVALRAISIGIRVYFISLCANGKQILPISTILMQFLSRVVSEFLINLFLLPVK